MYDPLMVDRFVSIRRDIEPTMTAPLAGPSRQALNEIVGASLSSSQMVV